MPTPAKPDELKILDGTWRADRDGDPSASVVAEGEPSCPSWLDGEALAYWREIVPDLVRGGLAKARDSAELAAMCEWWGMYRRLSRSLDRAKPKERHSVLVQVAICWDKYHHIAQRFGLTPADRAKMRLPASVAGSAPKVRARKRG